MNTIIIISFWLGVLTLIGIALNFFFVAFVFLLYLPIDLIKSWQESRRTKKKHNLIRQAVNAFAEIEAKQNADKAYKSGVKKVSKTKTKK